MFAKLQSLQPIERRALVPAFARLIVTRLILVTGIRNTSRWLGQDLAPAAPFDHRLWKARARVLNGLSARLPGMACLTSSLALRWWMRAEGLDAGMKVGIRKTPEKLHSHAWVELEGQPIAESESTIGLFRVIESY